MKRSLFFLGFPWFSRFFFSRKSLGFPWFSWHLRTSGDFLSLGPTTEVPLLGNIAYFFRGFWKANPRIVALRELFDLITPSSVFLFLFFCFFSQKD